MKRHGFTLVEIMVAMALTLFVMVILSQAFIAALDTFSGLKAIGDMDEGIRTTVNNLRNDLMMNHLLNTGTGTAVRLKDVGTSAYDQGFFVIRQGTATTSEGTDLDGLGTARAVDHVLHFSVNASQIHLPGGTIVSNRPENFFVAGLPAGSPLLTTTIDANYPAGNTPYRTGNTVSSPWAEVSYFLVAQGSTSSPNSGSTSSGGTPLYKLYRSQFLAVTDKSLLTGLVAAGTTGYDTVSWMTATGNFNTPTDLATGSRVFNPASPGTTGATILLNNVVSFSVRAMRSGDTDFVDLGTNGYAGMYDTAGPVSPFAKAGGSLNFQDNSAATVAPLTATSITALEITIRVWDAKTQGTRQITIIQDM